MCIESPGFLRHYSGYKNLEFLASLNSKPQKEELEHVLQQVGLYEERNKKVGKYSMGMRQRLAIAQSIMEHQKILILDEPMNGLDNQGRLSENYRTLPYQSIICLHIEN